MSATVLLFHHALGRSPGLLVFADELRRAGHVVHAPDLFDGRVFATIEEGVAYAEGIGFDAMVRRGVATAEGLPADLVYAGFSLGVLPAQALAQVRPGARGALFYSACVPTSNFGPSWPEGVPVEIHIAEEDPWAAEDRDAARKLAASARDAEFLLYPGAGHLFADPSCDDYDEPAARLLVERTMRFLARVG